MPTGRCRCNSLSRLHIVDVCKRSTLVGFSLAPSLSLLPSLPLSLLLSPCLYSPLCLIISLQLYHGHIIYTYVCICIVMCICNIYWRVHFAGQCTRPTNTCARNSGQGHSGRMHFPRVCTFPAEERALRRDRDVGFLRRRRARRREHERDMCVAITCGRARARAIISSAVGKCLSLLISREYISVRGNDASVV